MEFQMSFFLDEKKENFDFIWIISTRIAFRYLLFSTDPTDDDSKSDCPRSLHQISKR